MTRGRRGFTLVETIFSTLFISLTVLAIINLFPGAYLSVKRSETQLQADLLANSILEDLRATPFAEIEDQSGTPVDPPANLPGSYMEYGVTGKPFGIQTIDQIEYKARVFSGSLPDTDPKILKGVWVEITYRVGPTSKTETYETYIHSLSR